MALNITTTYSIDKTSADVGETIRLNTNGQNIIGLTFWIINMKKADHNRTIKGLIDDGKIFTYYSVYLNGNSDVSIAYEHAIVKTLTPYTIILKSNNVAGIQFLNQLPNDDNITLNQIESDEVSADYSIGETFDVSYVRNPYYQLKFFIKKFVRDKESTSNKTSSWNSPATNTKYPTEKLVKDEIDSLNTDITNIWKTIYPVGSIYISVNNTNPSTLFGGMWEQIKDRFLLAVGDTYTNVSTYGGEATHTLTVDEMPSHAHTTSNIWNAGSAVSTAGNVVNWQQHATTDVNKINNTGGGQAHNNMPPYLTVYMWKRII